MSSDFDIRDVMLEAQADVQEVLREIMQEMMQPMIETQVSLQWASLPDDMKERFKRERPDAYAALMELLQQGE